MNIMMPCTEAAFIRGTIRAAGTEETPAVQMKPHSLMENPVFPASCLCLCNPSWRVPNKRLRGLQHDHPDRTGPVPRSARVRVRLGGGAVRLHRSAGCTMPPAARCSILTGLWDKHLWVRWQFCLPKAIWCSGWASTIVFQNEQQNGSNKHVLENHVFIYSHSSRSAEAGHRDGLEGKQFDRLR